MRIISGKYGGRKLVSFKADHIRPTTDRVKESLFNILMTKWDSARVLDLFSGTGNLAIEALSREAAYVEAVEIDPRSLEIIRANVKLLNIGPELKLVRSDVIKYLERYKGQAFDVVLVDPPFTESLSNEVLQTLSESRVIHDQTMIVIESGSNESFATHYGDLVCVDRRNFGDKIMSFFERKGR